MQYGAPSVQCVACAVRPGTHPCLPLVAQAHRTQWQLHLQFHMGHMRRMRQTTWCRSYLLMAGFVAQVRGGGPPGTTHLWGLHHGMAKAGSQTSSSMPSLSQLVGLSRGSEHETPETPETPIHSPMTWRQRPWPQRSPRSAPWSLAFGMWRTQK